MFYKRKGVFCVGKKSGTSGGKVLLNSIIYSFGGLLQKCFSFFLLPLYTAYLTTEDYGITSVTSSFVATAGYVVAFSLFSAVLRFYVDLKDDPEKLKRFYGSVVSFVFLSGTAFAGILWLLKEPVSQYLFSGIDFFPLIFVCLISLICNCQHTIFDNILKSQQKALKSSLCSILYFLLNVALNILFVVGFRMGALGTLLATAISGAVYTLYFVIEMSILRTIRFCLDRKLLWSALKYSVPIMPHNLSTHIAIFISKLLISDTGSLAHLGVYSVSTQFGQIADTVQNYVDSAYGPWLYERLHNREGDYKKTIRRNVNLLISVIGFFFLGISLFAQDYIVLLVDPSYVEAWRYVPLLVATFAIKTAYYFFVEVLFYFKEASRKLFWATLTGSFINIILSYFFIPLWGVYGSILADALSMLVRVGIVFVISKRYEDVGLRMVDFVRNFFVVEGFVALGLVLSLWKYPTSFSILNFGYKALITLLYVVVAFLLNRESAKALLVKLKNKRKK